MHLGKDEMNTTQIENFNSKYFKKDSFWEESGMQQPKLRLQSKTTGVVTNYGNLLNRDAPNMQSYSSFGTDLTEVVQGNDEKRDTLHQDFGQRPAKLD